MVYIFISDVKKAFWESTADSAGCAGPTTIFFMLIKK